MKYLLKKESFYHMINKNKCTFAFCVNTLLLVIISFLCNVHYEVSDDFVMETIVSGLYAGEKTIYLPYSNIGLGAILKTLYIVTDSINWYGIIMILGALCAVAGVLYCLMDKLGVYQGLMMHLIFMVFCAEDTFVSLQFTKHAALMMITGSFIFLHFLLKEDGLKGRFFGAILIVLGSWYRFYCVYIIAPYVLLMAVWLYWKNRTMDKKKLLQAFYAGTAVVVVVISTHYIDGVVRTRNPGMNEFTQYNATRGSLLDYPNYGYENNKEWIDLNGYSENDYISAVNWNFVDNEFFTQDTLEVMQEGVESTRQSVGYNQDNIVERIFDRNYKGYLALYGCLFLALLLAIESRNNIIIMLPCVAISATYFIYFFLVDRVVYRVEYSIIISALVFLLKIYSENCKANKSKKTILCALILILVFKATYVASYAADIRAYEMFLMEGENSGVLYERH